MRRLALLAALLLLGAAAAAGWWGYGWYVSPGPLTAPVTLVVNKGAGSEGIGRQLEAAGIVREPAFAAPSLFTTAARLTSAEGDLKAGEYVFPAGVTPEAVLALLRSGKVVVHHLTIPEGLSSAEIVALVNRADALQGDVGTAPAEGELFPATYNYVWGDTRAGLLDRMRHKMLQTIDQLWAERSPDLPLSDPHDAVILASIVEKETGIADERAKVAAVFYNRLKLDMKLQSDPTVIYALTQGREPLGRKLLKTDLDIDSPYNTYLVKGLPPGAIANPGRASLAAVLHPAETDALYFVADGTGGHVFAATLEQHKSNVDRWHAEEAGRKAKK